MLKFHTAYRKWDVFCDEIRRRLDPLVGQTVVLDEVVARSAVLDVAPSTLNTVRPA